MPIVGPERDRSPIRDILRGVLDKLRRRKPASVDRPPLVPPPPPVTQIRPRVSGPVPDRLRDELARLERLDLERERLGDSNFGQLSEDRIVWSELIELELQEVDEQVNRIRDAANLGRQPETSATAARRRSYEPNG